MQKKIFPIYLSTTPMGTSINNIKYTKYGACGPVHKYIDKIPRARYPLIII